MACFARNHTLCPGRATCRCPGGNEMWGAPVAEARGVDALQVHKDLAVARVKLLQQGVAKEAELHLRAAVDGAAAGRGGGAVFVVLPGLEGDLRARGACRACCCCTVGVTIRVITLASARPHIRAGRSCMPDKDQLHRDRVSEHLDLREQGPISLCHQSIAKANSMHDHLFAAPIGLHAWLELHM